MTLYGKGITVASGFDLAGAPVDHKYVAETTEEMQAYIESGAVFEGMQVYNKSDKTIYVYNGSSFQTMSASSGSAEIDLSNYVTLDGRQEITGLKTFSGDVTFNGSYMYVSNGSKIQFFHNTPANPRGSLDSTNYTGNSATATKLKESKNISVTGDATGSASFDGSADADITITLADSGVAAGTYAKVTVDAKGRVVDGSGLAVSDIPNLTSSKITDLGSAATKDIGSAAGNVPVLDTNGKLDASILPATAITSTFVKGSQSEMLALNAQEGDVCVRTDQSKTYILKGSDPSVLANWVQLATPTDSGYVSAVNGKTGAVTLTTSDITEGSNQYFTAARATSNFNTNFATKSVAGLSDGAHVVLDTDTIIINCGNA